MLIFFTSSWLMERLECGSVKSSIMGIWTTRCQILTKAYVLSYDCKVRLSLGGSKNEFWICFIFTSCTSNTGMPLLFFGTHILLFTFPVSFNEEDERMDGWMVVWTSTLFILSLFCLFPSGALWAFSLLFLNSLQYKKKL